MKKAIQILCFCIFALHLSIATGNADPYPVTLHIPSFTQQYPLTCWASVCANVINYWGKYSVSESQFTGNSNCTGEWQDTTGGYNFHAMDTILNSYEVYPSPSGVLSWDALFTNMSAGTPVICRWHDDNPLPNSPVAWHTTIIHGAWVENGVQMVYLFDPVIGSVDKEYDLAVHDVVTVQSDICNCEREYSHTWDASMTFWWPPYVSSVDSEIVGSNQVIYPVACFGTPWGDLQNFNRVYCSGTYWIDTRNGTCSSTCNGSPDNWTQIQWPW